MHSDKKKNNHKAAKNIELQLKGCLLYSRVTFSKNETLQFCEDNYMSNSSRNYKGNAEYGNYETY